MPGEPSDVGVAAGERILIALLAVGVLATYIAFERGRMVSWDGRAMSSVGQSLWTHGSVKECCNAFNAFPADHSGYAKFGIGLSAVLAPLWGVQLHMAPLGALWLGLANPVLLTATTVTIAYTMLALGTHRSTAALTGLAFALLTMAPFYSTEFFSEPGVAFGASLALLGFVLWPRRPTKGALIMGIGVAIAVMFRADSLLLVAPIVPALALHGRLGARLRTAPRWLPGLALPIAAAVAWTLHYNAIRFGSATNFGYAGHYDQLGFSTPLLKGVALLLWSPGKSLFLYAPILLAALPGLWLLRRRHWPVAAVVILLSAIRVGFFARWWTPDGGASWGPRLLLPVCALLAVPLGATIEHLFELRGRRRAVYTAGIGLLAALSAVVQFASVAVPYDALFARLYDLRSVPPPLRHAVRDQRNYRLLWKPSGNQIVWNLRHVTAEHFASLYWFRGRYLGFGIALLVGAFVCCAASAYVGHWVDRRSPHADLLPITPALSTVSLDAAPQNIA